MKILFVSSGNTKFGKVPFIESQERSLINNGVDLDHFLITENGISGYVKSIKRLRETLKKSNYDVIHAHYSYCAWVAVLTFTRIPIIISYMGSDVYGMVDGQGKRKLKSYLVIILAKLLQPFVDKIIVKSKNLEDYVYLKNKCEIVPNGVDFEKFQPRNKEEVKQKLGLSTAKKYITFLGSADDPRKNLQLLKAAVAYVNQKDWEILNPYPVEPQEIPYFINAGDTLVLASYLEGSPNVIKEAMASSVPIVATDVGDVKEVIGHTEGCYISDFDPKDMGEKLKKAMVFNGGTTTGRKDVEHLEINAIAKRLISIYQSLQQN